MAGPDRASPWLLSAILLVAFGPGLTRSSLLQGDLPGHLEAIRWSAEHLWPLPWGWDPRYLLGAPVGILYPPLLTWAGAALTPALGAEGALRLLLGLSVVAVPPAMFAAARGLGFRAPGAACAAAAGTALLFLPGLGLGGTFRQTFVAGNAANALALPLFLMFVARLRRGLGRPARVAGAAAALAGVLLSHFLLGAAAAAILSSYVLHAAIRRRVLHVRRGAGIAFLAALLAAPLLVPFVVHFREGSPDGIPYSPLPSPSEWGVLAAVWTAVALAGRPARRTLGPGLALATALLSVRAVVFPLLGPLPFRMEYHRFRLLLYLAAVPAVVFVLQRLLRSRAALRGLALAGMIVVAALAALAPYDPRGPEPTPVPSPVPSLEATRVLVLASPATQHGAWHALQLRLPPAMGRDGAKGLFVEASPFARAVFEAERASSPPAANPRWWAIRISPSDDASPDALLRRLAGLGVGAVVSREGVSARLGALATHGAEPLPDGYTLFRLPPYPAQPEVSGWPALPPVESSPIPARGVGVGRIERSQGGDRIVLRFREEPEGRAVLHLFAHSDWRIQAGDGKLSRVPLDPAAGIAAPLLEVRGRGEVVLRHAPRVEEWTGLGLGAAGLAGCIALAVSRRRGGAR